MICARSMKYLHIALRIHIVLHNGGRTIISIDLHHLVWLMQLQVIQQPIGKYSPSNQVRGRQSCIQISMSCRLPVSSILRRMILQIFLGLYSPTNNDCADSAAANPNQESFQSCTGQISGAALICLCKLCEAYPHPAILTHSHCDLHTLLY